MIQDIEPKHLFNEYRPDAKPAPADAAVLMQGGKVLVGGEHESITFPTIEQAEALLPGARWRYLFAVDEVCYFLAELPENEELLPVDAEPACLPGFGWQGVQYFRGAQPADLGYAAVTAFHLANWYRDTRFCGRCGTELVHDAKERMMRCPACGNMIFPRISPSVIVGVVDGDRLLLTKYAGRAYTRYALIAGFTEIGETPEQTVHREVMEEVGLRVKNIRYYKCQPWGFTGGLLLGYFCELDGDDTITLDRTELAVGEWVTRENFDPEDDGVSLTREMMRYFKEHPELYRE